MVITDLCTGCRLCEQICSHNAINIIQNEEGFLEACIDEASCVGCKLCQNRCPQNGSIEKNTVGLAFAVRLRDDTTLKDSASGGAFIGIAKAFISTGGYVAGVIYDNNWAAVYQITNDISGLKPMQSSKYLQADTGNIYSIIKEKLQKGEKVLFAGTSCQVAGLKGFLNKDYENLVTIDIICHGVTSPLMYREYVKWLEKKVNTKILSYNFRSKNRGWGLFYTYTYTSKGKIKEISKPMYVDPYYQVFLNGDAYRECCYRCKYASLERITDISIGDYWGIEEEHPSFFSSKGVSSVLINTKKGSELFNVVKSDFFVIASKPDRIARHNDNLIKPTYRNDLIRNSFYEGIKTDENWFNGVAEKYKPTFVSLIKARVPSSLRALINKILTR